MTESFAQLFEESLKEIETRPGSIVRGVVVAIDKDIVLVDAGLKSESAIPAEQFKNAQGELEIQVGDEVDGALDAVRRPLGRSARTFDQRRAARPPSVDQRRTRNRRHAPHVPHALGADALYLQQRMADPLDDGVAQPADVYRLRQRRTCV